MKTFSNCHRVLLIIITVAIFSGALILERQVKKAIIAGIIPHHLVAKDLIEDFFLKLKKSSPPRTIVIVSPDHFHRIPAPIVTGKIGIPDQNILNLLQSLGVSQSSPDIRREHGITNLIPFIQKNLPETKIVPILVSEDVKIPLLDKLAKALARETDDTVFFLASADFSHHLPKNATLFHDLRSIGVFAVFDEKFFPNLETDLWQTLYLTRKIAYLKGANDWNLIAYRNTSDYLPGIIEDNVGYVTAFLKKGGRVPKSRTVNLLFFGDVMLDRGIRAITDRDRFYPWKRIHHFMTGVDIVSGNLEGPIVEKRPPGFYEYRFAFPPEVASVLRAMDFSILNLANNHILDAGAEGLLETKNHLEKAGLSFPPKEFLIGNKKIAFLGYSPFLPNFHLDEIVKEVKTFSERNNFTAVQMHWGQEYSVTPTQEQKEMAKAIISAGADIIVGHGPHVIQPYEFYKGKPIFYSLGNFIFDQGGNPLLEEGLALGITLEEDQIRYFLFPLSLKNSQPKLLYTPSKNVTLGSKNRIK